MKNKVFGIFSFSCAIVLGLSCMTGCNLFGPRYTEDQLSEMRRNLQNSIELQDATIRQELLSLTERHREERMKTQRLRLEELELEALKMEYNNHLKKARELEEHDRMKLNDHFRYNDIVMRKLPPVKDLSKKIQSSHKGWTLIVDWHNPVRENCVISGGDFCFNAAYAGKNALLNAYLVVLTPVVKDKIGVPMTGLAGYSEEAINADDLTTSLNNRSLYDINRNYRVPHNGYHRVQMNADQPYGKYVISGAMRINRFGYDFPEEVIFISVPLRYDNNPISRFTFPTRIAAFAGDYIALLVPSDDTIAVQDAPSGDEGDSYYQCPNFASEDNLLKLHSYRANYSILFELTKGNRLMYSGKRRAAFSVYGDYLVPK